MQEKDNVQPPTRKPVNETVTYATPVVSTVGDYMPLHPSGRSWEISREQVTVIKVIGKGAFSQVAQASVRDMRGRQENITVAVKMLKGGMPLIIVTIIIFMTLSRQKLNKEIVMRERDEEDLKKATECYICNNPYTPSDIRVLNHCHVSIT